MRSKGRKSRNGNCQTVVKNCSGGASVHTYLYYQATLILQISWSAAAQIARSDNNKLVIICSSPVRVKQIFLLSYCQQWLWCCFEQRSMAVTHGVSGAPPDAQEKATSPVKKGKTWVAFFFLFSGSASGLLHPPVQAQEWQDGEFPLQSIKGFSGTIWGIQDKGHFENGHQMHTEQGVEASTCSWRPSLYRRSEI